MMKRTSAGFTLLEVLVAFVILALTLGVILRIFSGGLRNAALAGDYSHAMLLAESRLAELRVQPLEGETRGEFDGKYRWRSMIRPWVDGTAASGSGPQLMPVRLMEIDVWVAWGEAGGRSREIGLTTLQLVPASGPGS